MEYEFLGQVVYLGIWLFIPTIFDVGTGLFRSLRVMFIYVFSKNRNNKKHKKDLVFKPLVSIVIPIYNSEKTLKRCIESIVNQTYDIDKIEVILVDNGSRDNSYEVFQEIQFTHSNLKIWWYKSGKGKAKALNSGIYYANGEYIVNIDSDGYLSDVAIEAFARKFEENIEISAMTGSVIIDHTLIKESKGFFHRLLIKCEFMEYLEVFFIGRNNQSLSNNIFTMAGAISAIRKDIAVKSQMYNPTTLGEDAHMTQQILSIQGGKIDYCKEACFFTEPIEDIDKLCIQRDRWQRGALEVAGLFSKNRNASISKMLISDHAMTFPKLIWTFAMLYLGVIGFPIATLILVNIILYVAYSLVSLLAIIASAFLLGDLKEVRKYTICHVLMFVFMPIYRLLIVFFRINGIINSLSSESKWSGRGFKEEIKLGFKAIFSIKKLEDKSIKEQK